MPIPAVELEQLHLKFCFKEFNVLFKDKDSKNEAPNSYKMGPFALSSSETSTTTASFLTFNPTLSTNPSTTT